MELFEVQNLIFVLPLGAAFLLIFLMALGMPMGDHGVHAEIPHADAAVQAASVGTVGNVLAFLGVGRVPFAVTLISLSMVWGVSGLIVNQAWPSKHLWFPIAIAAAAAVIGTRWVSFGLSRFLPSVETYTVPASELVRQTAEVIHEVDGQGGLIRLTDRLGTLRDLKAKTGPAQSAIPRGCRVLLTEYHAEADCFRVEALTAPEADNPTGLGAAT